MAERSAGARALKECLQQLVENGVFLLVSFCHTNIVYSSSTFFALCGYLATVQYQFTTQVEEDRMASHTSRMYLCSTKFTTQGRSLGRSGWAGP